MPAYTKDDLRKIFYDPDNVDYKMQYRYESLMNLNEEQIATIRKKIFKHKSRELIKNSSSMLKSLSRQESSIQEEEPEKWQMRNEVLWQALSKAVLEIPEKNPVRCFDKLFVAKYLPP